jgi:N-acetylglutamate synthase-like GNAT family acetyltransferase
LLFNRFAVFFDATANCGRGGLRMAITIREACESDGLRLGEIGEAATKILRRTYRPSVELVKARNTQADQWTVIVAKRASMVVGGVEIKQVGSTLHVRGLAVDPAFHRTGVARALTDFLSRRAQELGAERLSLFAIAETGNVSAFERLGFHAVSSGPAIGFESDSHSELREVCMERIIS